MQSGSCILLIMRFIVVTARLQLQSVAVCVTGQLGRLLPQFLIKDVIKPNQGYYFDIYVILQAGNQNAIFSTNIKSKQSAFASLDKSQVPLVLSSIFNSSNSKLAELSFMPFKPFKEWHSFMNIKTNTVHDQPNLFDQFKESTTMESIFNMYAKIAACAESILQSKTKYDAVLLSRDDLYFFRPVDLNALIPLLKRCDVIAKNCLNWGGINMRLQVLSINLGLQFLREHLEFCKYLYKFNMTVNNTESFELAHAKHLSASVCHLPVDQVPSTGARLIHHNKICFLEKEVFACVPKLSNITGNCSHDPWHKHMDFWRRTLGPASTQKNETGN